MATTRTFYVPPPPPPRNPVAAVPEPVKPMPAPAPAPVAKPVPIPVDDDTDSDTEENNMAKTEAAARASPSASSASASPVPASSASASASAPSSAKKPKKLSEKQLAKKKEQEANMAKMAEIGAKIELYKTFTTSALAHENKVLCCVKHGALDKGDFTVAEKTVRCNDCKKDPTVFTCDLKTCTPCSALHDAMVSHVAAKATGKRKAEGSPESSSSTDESLKTTGKKQRTKPRAPLAIAVAVAAKPPAKAAASVSASASASASASTLVHAPLAQAALKNIEAKLSKFHAQVGELAEARWKHILEFLQVCASESFIECVSRCCNNGDGFISYAVKQFVTEATANKVLLSQKFTDLKASNDAIEAAISALPASAAASPAPVASSSSSSSSSQRTEIKGGETPLLDFILSLTGPVSGAASYDALAKFFALHSAYSMQYENEMLCRIPLLAMDSLSDLESNFDFIRRQTKLMHANREATRAMREKKKVAQEEARRAALETISELKKEEDDLLDAEDAKAKAKK